MTDQDARRSQLTCPSAQILQIKESLQEKEGIDVKQIRLIHSGKQLWVLQSCD